MGNRSTKTPVSQWGRSTLAALAAALGVHRNWVGELVDRGAPGGPPYCELAWRTWMAANGHEPKAAPEAPLLELLAKSGIPFYRKLLLGDQAEAAGEVSAGERAKHQTAITFEERRDKAEAEKAENAAALSAIELGVKQKRIIHIDDLHRLVAALGKLWQPLMRRVPDACLTDRVAVEAAIAEGQKQLVAGMERELLAFLEEISRGS